MNQLKDSFFFLLRLGLWGKTSQHQTLHFSDEEWTAIRQMSMIQTVQGIVFDGVMLLPEEQKPPVAILTAWKSAVRDIEHKNKKQQVQLVQLHYFFETEHNLTFRLIKGQTVARHYHYPLHRYCGDLDLWFGNKKNAERANQLMEDKGVKVFRGYDGDGEYYWYDTPVEHKFRLVELSNPFLQKKLKAWERLVFVKSGEEPLPEANLLLQITHILKHFIKGGGLGFRHVCDLAVSFRSLIYDARELKVLCKKYGIYRWADMLASLIHQVLEVPLDELPFPCKEDPKPLLEEMWIAGNFGIGDSRFGTHPEGRWGSKIYTFSKVWQKTKVLWHVAPNECFWNMFSMVGNNVITLFRKN